MSNTLRITVSFAGTSPEVQRAAAELFWRRQLIVGEKVIRGSYEMAMPTEADAVAKNLAAVVRLAGEPGVRIETSLAELRRAYELVSSVSSSLRAIGQEIQALCVIRDWSSPPEKGGT